MRRFQRAAVVAASLATAVGSTALASAATDQPALVRGASPGIKHVLLISVDGLHQQDLTWYVQNFPLSTLANLDRRGLEYSNALTPFPSDSYPGIVGQMTGGDPGVTGIYYDDTWNHGVFPAGTTNCTGPVPGGEAAYMEAADIDQTRLDAGQGLKGLPGSILQMTGNPLQVINPANLPVDPATCKPILPNQYIHVNTIFNVASAAGLRTAWSDKHPANQVLSGPSGNGPQDYFTPEINSQAIGFPAGQDWTNDNAATMKYDNFKVQAVLNWIRGFDHSGRHFAGIPAIFGMNFQTVSTAQKLPASDGLIGGYKPGGTVPGPLLIRALNYINSAVGKMVNLIRQRGIAGSTAIIISAKHGQSPTNPNDLKRVPDSAIISAINAAWAVTHPSNPNLVIFASDDDGMLLWLSDRSQTAANFVKQFLLTHSAAGNDIHGNPITVSSSGLTKVFAGSQSAAFFGVPNSDPRHPDVLGIAQHGIVYTGGMSKIAEHGGDGSQDRNVPILVVLPGSHNGSTITSPVETTQIAPTILALLGLTPSDLQAVQIEHTQVLPGITG
jgi:hypothetical protein